MDSRITQTIMSNVFLLSCIVTFLILAIIVGYILINGLPVLNLEFIMSEVTNSGKSGGIFPMILSSVYLIITTLAISVPISIAGAVYVSEYAVNKTFIKIVNFLCEVLSAVPSIIFGLFGLAFFIFTLKFDWSIFVASCILSLMAIPTIFQISYLSIKSVPDEFRQASICIGATKEQVIKSVILPIALSGIFTGIVLAMTRAISEAAAVMYVAGSSLSTPLSIFDSGRPLPLHLYLLASEGISMENAYGTASVLLIGVFLITLFSNFFINYYQQKLWGGN